MKNLIRLTDYTLNDFVAAAKEIIGEQLTGIYLHGSLAMGCFNPDKSDIDLIMVIEEGISDEQKMKFMERVVVIPIILEDSKEIKHFVSNDI